MQFHDLPWRDVMWKERHLGVMLVSGDIPLVPLSQVWARDLVLRYFQDLIRAAVGCKHKESQTLYLVPHITYSRTDHRQRHGLLPKGHILKKDSTESGYGLIFEVSLPQEQWHQDTAHW